jgi:hypothetical protein
MASTLGEGMKGRRPFTYEDDGVIDELRSDVAFFSHSVFVGPLRKAIRTGDFFEI